MDIKDLIPQREPFLFVDEIIGKDENKIMTTYKVKGTEDFFKGHFPGNPIMPGVLLQEALFQSAAALMAGIGKGTGVVTRVQNAKFKNLTKPGDDLNMEVVLIDQIENAYYFKGKTKVDNKLAVSIEFACALLSNWEKKMDFLQVKDKTFLITGVSNRKSVAYVTAPCSSRHLAVT